LDGDFASVTHSEPKKDCTASSEELHFPWIELLLADLFPQPVRATADGQWRRERESSPGLWARGIPSGKPRF